MALTTAQIASYLFKKLQGKSSASTAKDFFEEPYNGLPAVLPSQVWAEGGKIPTTAPGGTNLQVTGVVKRYIDLVLTAVPGVSNAFYSANLVDAIPFNFGDGSYNFGLKDSSGAAVPFGLGDWIVDPATGVVTFYTTTPSSVPPKISFYQYVGQKGVAADTVSETSQTLTEGGTSQNVTALLFSGAAYKTAIVEWQLYRVSTGGSATEICGYGRFAINYKPTAATWGLTPLEQASSDGADLGIAFDVNSSGQVQYTMTTLPGTSPVSTLKSRARTFTA